MTRFLSIAAALITALCAFPLTASARFLEDLVPKAPAVQEAPMAEQTRSTPASAPDATVLQQMPAPDEVLSRGQFVDFVVETMYGKKVGAQACFASLNPKGFTLLFRDVPVTSPYAHALCIAMHEGLIRGYGDGSFHPDADISFVEAGVIIARAHVLAPYAETESHIGPWFGPYIMALADRNAIPPSIVKLSDRIRAADAGEMLVRLQQGITWAPARTFADLMAALFPKPVSSGPMLVPATGLQKRISPIVAPPAASSAASSAKLWQW